MSETWVRMPNENDRGAWHLEQSDHGSGDDLVHLVCGRTIPKDKHPDRMNHELPVVRLRCLQCQEALTG